MREFIKKKISSSEIKAQVKFAQILHERGVHINKFLSNASLGSQIEKPLEADNKNEPRELLMDDVVVVEELNAEVQKIEKVQLEKKR